MIFCRNNGKKFNVADVVDPRVVEELWALKLGREESAVDKSRRAMELLYVILYSASLFIYRRNAGQL